MSLALFIILLTTFISDEPVSEAYYFDIIRHSKVIGELRAVKTTKNDHVTYESFTDITATFIKKIEVKYEFEVTMKEDYLVDADVKIEVNGKVHTRMLTKRKGDKYEVESKTSALYKLFPEVIEFPGILFVFKEPVNRSRSYSEEEGDFHSLEAMGNNSYKKVNQKGRTNMYHYHNGKLLRAEIDAGFVRFEIIARE